MTIKIERDHSRFKQIVRGKIRENLAKVCHARRNDRPQRGRPGQHSAAPARRAPLPLWQERLAAASAKATANPARRSGPAQQGDGTGQAGGDPGAHILEVEVTLDELAAILGDELQLPRIEPKGKANITQVKSRYTSVRRSGPESLRHFKRTYMEALRRQISSNSYVPEKPRIVPIREDKRYRASDPVEQPQANAVIIYMMDVSGSMTDEQKAIVRTAVVLARYLAAQPIRRRRAALHHSRRGGQRGRRTDVLSHPRKRRHAHQFGLPRVCRFDRHASFRPRNGTFIASSFPTATTGAKTTNAAWSCCASRSCRT